MGDVKFEEEKAILCSLEREQYSDELTRKVGDVKFEEEEAMLCSLERELQIPLEEDLLSPEEEPQEVAEKP